MNFMRTRVFERPSEYLWRYLCKALTAIKFRFIKIPKNVFPDANPDDCCLKRAAMIVVEQWAIKRAACLSGGTWSAPSGHR